MDNEKLINDMEENPAEEFENKKKPDEECPNAQEENKDGAPATEEKKDKPKAEEENDKKKKKYNLEEVTEYVELQEKYNELQEKYSALEQEKATLDTENAALKEFKLVSERKNKQDMIDSFYMLSDEDKKDVIEHIDTYSLDTIEAKLSVICVRNKVDFSLKDMNKDENPAEDSKPQGTFNLNAGEDNAPAWIKAVKANEKK